MKRILTVQDISCVGKCSLTVALPILSSMGLETAVLPTAVLSTHTAFKNFTFRDLTGDMLPIARHWRDEGIEFSSVYTGYLGSEEQLGVTETIFDMFKKPGVIIFIDPVMADNGKLYKGFTKEFAGKMAKLCSKADVIVPNLSEAAFMLGEDYTESYDRAYIKEKLKKLCGLGAGSAVLTGVSFEDGRLGAVSYSSDGGVYHEYFRERLPVNFHGTGDIFASVMLGGLERGLCLGDSLETAVDFCVESIKKTMENPNHNWYGVDFESVIPLLLKKLG